MKYEQFYAIAANELATGNIDKDIMRAALHNSYDDQAKANERYIRNRVIQLRIQAGDDTAWDELSKQPTVLRTSTDLGHYVGGILDEIWTGIKIVFLLAIYPFVLLFRLLTWPFRR